MFIAIDPEDVRKKYARKMEFLERVRDGSEKEIGSGIGFVKPWQRIFGKLRVRVNIG